MKTNYSFGPESRMKSEKQIAALFKQNESTFVHPIKCLFNLKFNQEPGKTQVLITVPKRNFKSAVKRNKIKRLIREAYRLQKPAFETTLSEKQLSAEIVFIYLGKEIIGFHKMETVMMKLIAQITSFK